MANIKSAKKRAKQSEVRREQNVARRTGIKTAIKKVMESMKQKADATKTHDLLRDVAAKLARAKSKGTIHRNTAARKLSRLAKRVHVYDQSKQKQTSQQSKSAQ